MHATRIGPRAIRARAPERAGERGVALVFALLGILVLSMLAASLMFVTSAESFASFNYKTQIQANATSTAGVQRAMDWFRTNYGTWLDDTGVTTTQNSYDFSTQPPTYNGASITLGCNASNFPDATIVSGFNGTCTETLTIGNATGTYVATASLLAHDRFKKLDGVTVTIQERWGISLTGTVPGALGNTVVQDTATIERIFIPTYKDAIRGKCSVNIGGAINTDSYYSTSGAYGGSNLYTGGDAQASVGSNAIITATGTSGAINGNAYWETSNSGCTGGDGIAHPNIVQGQILQAPGVPYPAITPTFGTDNDTTNDCSGNSDRFFAPDTPATHYHTCNPGGNATVTLCLPNVTTTPPPPATFFFNNLTMGGTQNLYVKHFDALGGCTSAALPCTALTPCPPVKLYVNETLNVAGAAGIGMFPSNPTQFSILYSGTNTATFGGTSDYSGTIYAPNATLTLQGNGAIYGAVSAYNVQSNGGVTVHYDLALQTYDGMMSPFRISNQTRNVF